MSSNKYIFIDESGLDKDSKYTVMAAVITDKLGELEKKIRNLVDVVNGDPDFRVIPSIQAKEGISYFHYCDDHAEIRAEFTKLIRTLPIFAYISFAKRDSSVSKKEVHFKLIQRLLQHLIVANKDSRLSITYEGFDEGSELYHQKIVNFSEKICCKTYSEKQKEKVVKVIKGDKANFSLSVADYFCGVFRDALQRYEKSEAAGAFQTRAYHSISGRIRYIYCFDTDKVYSRKNTFYLNSLN